MAIQFRCSACQRWMSIASRQAGRQVPCPVCGAEILVPLDSTTDSGEQLFFPEVELSAADEEFADVSELDDLQADSPADADELSSEPAVTEVAPVPVDHPDEKGSPRWSRRRRLADDEELDLTAMVDVVFQLLIFFMVTASFTLQKSIQLPASDDPQKGAAPVLVSLDDLEARASIVRIDENGQLSVDDEPLAEGQSLREVLQQKMAAAGKVELIIAAHSNAPHRSVVEVVDLGNSLGIERIRLARFQAP